MNNKRYLFHLYLSYHLGNFKGFRSSVPETDRPNVHVCVCVYMKVKVNHYI